MEKEARDYTVSESQQDVSFSNEISTTTLVKLLVRKGILTTKEVLEEERLTRLQQHIVDANLEHEHSVKKKKMPRFKQWASRHRWSRRVTARLFGWEWKRAKHNNGTKEE